MCEVIIRVIVDRKFTKNLDKWLILLVFIKQNCKILIGSGFPNMRIYSLSIIVNCICLGFGLLVLQKAIFEEFTLGIMIGICTIFLLFEQSKNIEMYSTVMKYITQNSSHTWNKNLNNIVTTEFGKNNNMIMLKFHWEFINNHFEL